MDRNPPGRSGAYLLPFLLMGALLAFPPAAVGAEEPAVNLALGAVASASSEQGENPASGAIDGDSGTRWCAESSAVEEWWRADFTDPQTLSAIELEWEFPGKTYRHRVEVSPDGERWIQAVDAAAGLVSPVAAPLDGALTDGVKAVRIVFLGADGWGSLREVRLLAPAGTPVPPAPKPVARSIDHSSLLRGTRMPAGFTATVFAGPDVANYPVFVAATVDGTLYVSSDGNGSLGRDPHRGRVLRLRDTDGDGTADHAMAFVADLDSPRGLVVVDDNLIVLHPPHVSAFRDSDGDGVADDQRRLVEGIAFGYADRPADHTSNGLSLGIDGWVYAAIGDFGCMDAVGSDGRRLQLHGGGVVRFRPDGSGLELFARGTRNILEVAVGPQLDMVARDNTNDGGGWDVRLHAFTGLEDHGYPRRYLHFTNEIVPPLADYGGGSGSGACWIDEPWMPREWNDAPFTCDWGRGTVTRHPLSWIEDPADESAGKLVAGEEAFLSIDRATDLDADAIGNLYAASWRNGGFSWSGPGVGFIARIRPEGLAAVELPDTDRLDPAALVNQLGGRSHRLRIEAQRALLRRGLDQATASQLEELAQGPPHAPLDCRVAAIFTLALGRGAAALPFLRLLATDAIVAPWVVRAVGDLGAAGTIPPAATLDAVGQALKSERALTRREAIIALARSAAPGAAAMILPLAADADRLVAHTATEAVVLCASHDAPGTVAACTAWLDAPSVPPSLHRAVVRVLGEIHDSSAVIAVLGRLPAETDPDRRANLAWVAARLFRRESAWKGESWGTRPDNRGPYFAAEEWAESPRLLDALLSEVEHAARGSADDLPRLAKTLGLHRIPSDRLLGLLIASAGRSASGREALATYLDLDGATPPVEAVPPLDLLATSQGVSPGDRLAALRILARIPEGGSLPTFVEAIVDLDAAGADTGPARELSRRVASATMSIDTFNRLPIRSPVERRIVDELLLATAAAPEARSAVRSAAAAILARAWSEGPKRQAELIAASRQSGSRVLANSLIEAAEEAEAPLAEAAREAIMALGIDPAAMRAVAADTGPLLGARPVGEILDLVDAQRGDRATGAALFAAKRCTACHATGVDATGLGPSLANAAAIYSRRTLAESILDPNRSIAQGFATTLIHLDDGRSMTGFVTAEGADELVLRDGEGKEHRIPQAAIEARTKLPTSIMPAGLVADLSVAQFASLLDFIEAIGQP